MKERYKEAKNVYFYAIRSAKMKYWEDFLSNVAGKDIFTAYNYTKARLNPILPRIRYLKEGEEAYATSFKEKYNAFLITLFPSPSPRAPSPSAARGPRGPNPASSILGPSVPRPSPP